MLIWSEKFRKVMPPLIKSISEAINTLGGSPMAVAAPPILEKITIAINTGTKNEKKNISIIIIILAKYISHFFRKNWHSLLSTLAYLLTKYCALDVVSELSNYNF